MSLGRLLRHSLRHSSTVHRSAIVHPISTIVSSKVGAYLSSTIAPTSITVRSFAFSSAEEAAAERRRRKRRIRTEPPLNAIRPPPQHTTRDPNAPRLPDQTSALVGPRLSLHNRVQSLIRAGDLDAASAVARQSVFSVTRPTVYTCNAIIAAMYRAKRYQDAIELFHFFFKQSNLVPNIVSYNNLILSHSEEGRVDDAIEVYRHVIANAPFSPSTFTYRHLTKGLVVAGRIDDAVDLLREMLSKGHGADSLVYNNLISGFLELGNLDKANEFFDELKERCLVYDGVVNATYMEWFFAQGRDKEAMDSYRSLMDRQFRMIPATCNVLLEVLLKHGKTTHAWELFDQMLDNHAPPNIQAVNSDTFNIMVNECFKLGKFAEALDTFKKVGTKSNSKAFSMDVAGYNNIITRFCENGMLSEAETLFQELCSKSLSPDVPTHRTLIDAYLKMERIDDALRVFHKMVDAGLRVVATFGNRVFEELIKNDKAIDCAQILSKMGEKDPKPDPSCYEVVIKGLCAHGLLDKSQELLDEVMRYRVGVTPALREYVTEVFKNAGRGEEIERLLDINRRLPPPRQSYRPPPVRSPPQMAVGAHNPPSGYPQQRPPLPSAHMAGAHNPPSGFPAQMAAPQQQSQHPSQGPYNSPQQQSQHLSQGPYNSPQQQSQHLSQGSYNSPQQQSQHLSQGPYNSPQQRPPLPSAHMAGVHSQPPGFPARMPAPQQQGHFPSQAAGTYNQPSGFPAQMTAQQRPPMPDVRMEGARNHHSPYGPPPQVSWQQRPPPPPQMSGMHQPSNWGVSHPMTGPRMPSAGPSPRNAGQAYNPPSEFSPHMERIAPQITSEHNAPDEPFPQMAGLRYRA